MPDTLNLFGTEYTNVTGIIAKDDLGNDLTFTRGGSATLITKSITANGTYSAQDDDADGYSSVTVNVQSGTPRTSTDLVVSGATVTAPAGVYAQDASKSVASGMVTAPASISGTAATVSTGTNTLTLSKTVSVTPTVSTAGYVSGGTAGNSLVSLTASVTTKGAATIYPSASDQNIAASQYLTGVQTIKAVTHNLDASKILSGTTFVIGDTADSDRVASVSGTALFQTIYSGSSAPSSSTGVNGDVFIQTV